MLHVLTWTYWASISAARAPNGLFGPNSFSVVAPFRVKFYFGPNIGMWGVQSVAMERSAHTALFQSIWNHPAEENGQNVNLGSCGGRGGLILRSAFATFDCSHNSCAGELPRSASSHFDSQIVSLFQKHAVFSQEDHDFISRFTQAALDQGYTGSCLVLVCIPNCRITQVLDLAFSFSTGRTGLSLQFAIVKGKLLSVCRGRGSAGVQRAWPRQLHVCVWTFFPQNTICFVLCNAVCTVHSAQCAMHTRCSLIHYTLPSQMERDLGYTYRACVPKTQRTKSKGPKGLQLEAGAQRPPGLLVWYIKYIDGLTWRSNKWGKTKCKQHGFFYVVHSNHFWITKFLANRWQIKLVSDFVTKTIFTQFLRNPFNALKVFNPICNWIPKWVL